MLKIISIFGIIVSASDGGQCVLQVVTQVAMKAENTHIFNGLQLRSQAKLCKGDILWKRFREIPWFEFIFICNELMFQYALKQYIW